MVIIKKMEGVWFEEAERNRASCQVTEKMEGVIYSSERLNSLSFTPAEYPVQYRRFKTYFAFDFYIDFDHSSY
jgi:hypothetical protein